MKKLDLKPKDGKDGSDGLGAYEIALNEGFEGSLSEWLDSLKGVDGLNGKDGVDGINGVDGKDGLDGKNGINGKDGKDGLDGLDGLDGNNGTNGIDGADGRNGKDGESAYQIAVRNGFKGSEDKWLRSLKGKDGKDGEVHVFKAGGGGSTTVVGGQIPVLDSDPISPSENEQWFLKVIEPVGVLQSFLGGFPVNNNELGSLRLKVFSENKIFSTELR